MDYPTTTKTYAGKTITMSSNFWRQTRQWEQEHKPFFTFSRDGLLCPICANWCELTEFDNIDKTKKFVAFGCTPHGFLDMDNQQFIVTTKENFARGEDGDSIGNIDDPDEVPDGAYKFAYGVPPEGY